MEIKKKIPLLFTLLVFAILLSNNTVHFLRSKDQLINSNEREITLMAQELSNQVQQAKEGGEFVEDILGKELRVASVAIKKSLPPRHEQVTNAELEALSKELMISHITLLAKTKDDIIGVKSSDPNEVGMSTKDWGYWHDAFQQLFKKQKITVGKGQTLPSYWSGPIEVASSNPDHTDKWGYFYDGSTNYIIDPYLRDKDVLEYGDRFGPERIIKRFTKNLPGVLELTVFNPKKFGEKKEVMNDNGVKYVRISSQPYWFGSYKYENQKKDLEYIKRAVKTGKQQSYIANLRGKKVQKTFVPSISKSDEPFVLGFAYDYGLIQHQLQNEMVKHIFLSGIFMLIVLAISVLFSKTITSPIDYIVDQVNEIAKGNFGKTIKSDRKDELGFLAENVNEMSISLKTYVDHFKESQKLIEYQAAHDPLTGLPNRRYFNEKLSHLLGLAQQNKQKLAVAFIDIDRFKNINDSLGHTKGDELIQQIAQRLKKTMKNENCLISRQGGDEFIIILENTKTESLNEKGTRIVEALKKPYLIDGTEVFVGASCGISIYPDHSENLETLVMYADMAMYDAKNLGGNRAALYHTQLNEKNHDHLMIETQLRKAIKGEALQIFYQPKVNARTGYIIGAEALVRWTDEVLGTVSPAKFIPIAEEAGLIQPLWEFVMKQACQQAEKWNKQNGELLSMAVNFSARQFQDAEAMVKKVRRILAECKFPPSMLEIEITESVLLHNKVDTLSALRELREEGVKISIDDFGTGYSSLSYLKNFPIDKLKIDQSFIQDIDEDYQFTEITDAIINLARSLRLQVIAEGVEEEHQLRYLLENNCEEMQGYYFSKPVDAIKFEELLKKQGTYTA